MIKYVKPLPLSSSKGLAAEVYGQIRRDFGSVAEPFRIHAIAPQLLAGYWTVSRETIIAAGHVPRALKEAVSAAVSKVNQCPYCVDAHTMMLMASGGFEAAEKISNDRSDEISDAVMHSAVKWSLATRSPGASILSNPPFTAIEAPEMIGTALIYHYINRLVTVL